jgi:hypothetical protein
MTKENKSSARWIAEVVYDESNICPLDDLLDPSVFNREAIPELQRGIEGS